MKTKECKIQTKISGNIAASVKRPGVSNVRAVPNFAKLHKKWEKELTQGKACKKKPLTVVEAFDLTNSNYVQMVSHSTKVLNDEDKENCKFQESQKSLQSILNGKGISQTETGRATIISTWSSKASLLQPRRATVASRPNRNNKHIISDLKKTSRPNNEGSSAQSDFQSPDFTSMAKEQKANGVTFVNDCDALESILSNTGIESKETESPNVNTNPLPSFKTPTALPPRTKITTDIRRSIYYTGSKGSSFAHKNSFTEYTCHVASRLTVDGHGDNKSAVKHASVTSPSPYKRGVKTVPQRGSIYCKVEFSNTPKQTNTQNVSAKCVSKPLRVQVEQQSTPQSSSRRQIKNESSKKTPKWRDILQSCSELNGAKNDKLATRLNFKDEEDDVEEQTIDKCSTPSVNNLLSSEETQLKNLEELEKRLEEDIALTGTISSSGQKPNPFVITTKPSTSAAECTPQTKKRIALAALSKEEIARRSNGYCTDDPLSKQNINHTPSPKLKHLPRVKGSESPRFRRELSPLVRATKSVTSSSRSVNKSPCSLDFGQLDNTLDIIDVNATKSNATILGGTLESSNDLENTLSKGSPLQELSPNVNKKVIGTSYRSSLESKVWNIASTLDKENFGISMGLEKSPKFMTKSLCISPSKSSTQSFQDLASFDAFDKENIPPPQSSPQKRSGTSSSLSSDDSPLATPLKKQYFKPEKSPRCKQFDIDNSTNDEAFSPKRRLVVSEYTPENSLPRQKHFSSCSSKNPKDVTIKRKVSWEDDQIRQNVVVSPRIKLLDTNLNKMTLSEAQENNNKVKEEITAGTECVDNGSLSTSDNLLKQLQLLKQKQDELLREQKKVEQELLKQERTIRDCNDDKHETNALDQSCEKMHSSEWEEENKVQTYADFIAANVVDISPSTSNCSPSVCKSFTNIKSDQVVPTHTNVQSPRVAQYPKRTTHLLVGSPLPVICSPKAVLSGSAQLIQGLEYSSPAPIRTPLVLQNMAKTIKPENNNMFIDISFTPEEMSPAIASQTALTCNTHTEDKRMSEWHLPSTPRNINSTNPSGQALSSSITTNTLSLSKKFTHTEHSTGNSEVMMPQLPTFMSPSTNTSKSKFRHERQSSRSPRNQQGSLSLISNLHTQGIGRHSENMLLNTTLSNAIAKYYDALLDDEVALYACRMQSSVAQKLTEEFDRYGIDPVANVLLYGDNMHFIPVSPEQQVPSLSESSQISSESSVFSAVKHTD